MATKDRNLTDMLAAFDREGSPHTRGSEAAVDRLFTAVYAELRRLAAGYLSRERPGHTLQATALANEAYLRLVDQSRVAWRGRTHFFAVAAQAMRRVLVDHARARLREKRGGGLERVTFIEDANTGFGAEYDLEDVVALDEALTKLAQVDEREAKLVEQRFFGGLSVDEAAAELGISTRTAEGDWTHAKAWLNRALTEIRSHDRH
jgi:RNA polymerase sigma-70 factor (ECF subfamily)